MAIIGTAYIKIHALTDKVNDDVKKSLAAQDSTFKQAGQRLGETFQKSFNSQKLGFDKIDTSSFEESSRAINNVTSRTRQNIERETGAIERAFLNAGKRSGSNFASNFGEGNISMMMKRLFYQILFGIPAVGALVGAISSLISGLFSLGAAVGPAANALAVLPGLLSAGVGAIAAIGLGFRGVGKAFSAGAQSASSGGAKISAAAKRATKTVAVAVKSISGAGFQIDWQLPEQRAVRDAYEQTAEQINNSIRNVANAEKSLQNAQNAARSAQEAINEARRTAANQLIEMGFAAEQASISEGRAAIALERAQEKYARVMDLPPNHRLRREAELNLRQAELDLKEATKKNQDAATEQADATAKGIEGSDEVVEARQNEADAVQSVIDAQEELARAQRDLEKTQRDSAEQIADAIKNAATAQEEFNEAVNGGGGGINRFADAMSKLSPQAREFVKYLLSIRGEFKAMADQAGVDMFPRLTIAIQTLINSGFLDLMGTALRQAGGAIGTVAIEIAKLTESPFFRGNFAAVGDSNVVVIESLGRSLRNVIDLFFAVAAAAAPVTEQFVAWIETVTGNWSASAQNNFEGLRAKIVDGAGVVSQLGRIFGLLWDNLKLVGGAARDSGQTLLDAFEGALEKLREFLGAPEQQETMKKYFADVATNVIAIGGLFNSLTSEFIKLGDNPAIANIAGQLADLAPHIGELLSSAMESVGPAMADLVSQLVGIFETLTSNGGLEQYISILENVASVINTLAENPAFAKLIQWFALLFASWKAWSLIAQVFQVKTIVSGISTVAVGMKSVVDGMRGVSSASSAAMPALSSFGSGLASAASGAKAFVVQGAQVVATLARQAAAWIAATAQTVASTAATWLSIAAQKAAQLAATAWAAAQRLLNLALTMNPIGLIIAAIAALVAGFIWLWNNVEGFRNFFIEAWDIIKNAVSTVVDWITSNWPKLLAVISVPIQAAWTFIVNTWNSIYSTIQTVINAIRSVISTVFNAVSSFISSVWNGIGNVIQAVWSFIVSVVTTYINNVRNTISVIGNAISSVWNSIWSGISSFVSNTWNGIVGFFNGAVGTFSSIFSSIANAVSSPFRSAFNTIVDLWNKSIGSLSWTIPDWVPGIGGNKISAPKLPRLAEGGIIKATPGGVAAIMGEAGKSERVTPLGNDGLSAGERQIRDALLSLTSGMTSRAQIVINPPADIDISTLARLVSRELAFQQ